MTLDHEQAAKDTILMNYETEEQSDLKNEISDYLGQYHGGHAEGSDLDCIEAAEHIVTALAEPAIRAMIALRVRELHAPEVTDHGTYCVTCSEDYGLIVGAYPCPPIRALEGP